MEADARNRRLGPLVQHPPPPPRLGWHHATTSRKPTHNDTKGSGLDKPPQNPGLDKQREGHCTRYGARHPIRRGALPTDRVHCPPRQAQLRTVPPDIPKRQHQTQPHHLEIPARLRTRGATPDPSRCTRYMALHPLRGATPDQKGCTAYGSGAYPITRTNAESVRRSPTRRQHAGDTPAASSSCCKPPLPSSRPLRRGRILTVPLESAPAGQVAVAGAVERPESDDGNHPSKSRT